MLHGYDEAALARHLAVMRGFTSRGSGVRRASVQRISSRPVLWVGLAVVVVAVIVLIAVLAGGGGGGGGY